ncbi:MAG: polysaccharide biosynthesis C-terminal domain-containing protein [Anaerofustis sp.]
MDSNNKKSYLTSAAILAAGGIFAKVLGIFFKSPLNTIIGDYGLGLYGYPYPLYTTFLAISIAGLPVAVSKMIAERVSIGNYRGAYKVFHVAFSAMLILGIVASGLMFLGAQFFIDAFNWPQDTYYSILTLSFAPFFVALISAFRGFFQGMQSMSFSSGSQIIEQIARVGIGLSLAVILTNSYGIAYGAAGATFGATVGAIVAFLFLLISFLRFRKKQMNMIELQLEDTGESNRRILKALVLLAIPIACGSLINTVMELINSATLSTCLQNAGVSQKAATVLYAQLEQKAQTLINVPLVIGSALASSLVPAISESYIRGDKVKILQKTTLAIKIAFLVSIPSSVGLSVLSEPITSMVFLGKGDGYQMLTWLAYVVVFTIVMSTLQGILQGSGRFYKPLKNMAFGALLKFLLNIALISRPEIGVYGAVASSIIASFVIFLLNYLDVKKYVGIGKIGADIAKIAVSSLVMGLIAKFGYDYLLRFMDYKIAVIIMIVISVAVYFALIYMTKAITKTEIKEVRG